MRLNEKKNLVKYIQCYIYSFYNNYVINIVNEKS